MDRKRNHKSQENDRQKQGFLQIPLLQISENARKIKGGLVFHREPITLQVHGATGAVDVLLTPTRALELAKELSEPMQ